MRTSNRLFATMLAALVALLGTQFAAAQGKPPVIIGTAVGLSGANSVVAPSVVQATQLAIDEINAAGGILGRKVVLEVADDGSGAAGAQKAYDSLLFQKKVDAVISMETSAARNAALPIVTRARKPFIYTSFYEGRSCNRNMFINAWVPEQQVASVVDYFGSKLNTKSYFLVGSDYAFGRGMLEFTRKYILAKGQKVVGEEYLPMDGSDWTAIVSKLKASGADALISSTAGGAPNVTLTKQLRAAGVTIPFGNLAVDEGTAKSMGSDGKDVYTAGSYYTSIDTPRNKEFLAAMGKRFGAEMKTPNDLSVPQYEAVWAYKLAADKAGSLDTDKVLKALGEVSFNGPRGAIKMDKQHHAALNMYLGQVQADGSVKILETFEGVDPGAQCPNLK
ncbi:Aliphatic amidase expression-regulating protein [Xylophilus ampelinus]|nr:Aliphatic amidase expression-regulating protein [Xylophilus ampelinus]